MFPILLAWKSSVLRFTYFFCSYYSDTLSSSCSSTMSLSPNILSPHCPLWWKFPLNFFFFAETGFLPGCPGTHSVDQAGLELRSSPAPASQVLGLKACATIPGFHWTFNLTLKSSFPASQLDIFFSISIFIEFHFYTLLWLSYFSQLTSLLTIFFKLTSLFMSFFSLNIFEFLLLFFIFRISSDSFSLGPLFWNW
jgi:hypothetical protein